MQEALEGLPGVDHAEVKVGEGGSAVCSVNSKFNEADAIAAIEGAGDFKATKAASE